METSKCLLMDEWIKMCCISQLYKFEYYSAIKKKEILPFVPTLNPISGNRQSTLCLYEFV